MSRMIRAAGTGPSGTGAAYSPTDLQALRVSDSGTVRTAVSDRPSAMLVLATFKPYVFGQSDPMLRPAVSDS